MVILAENNDGAALNFRDVRDWIKLTVRKNNLWAYCGFGRLKTQCALLLWKVKLKSNERSVFFYDNLKN